MPHIQFTRQLDTKAYGPVVAGQIADVSDVDAERYVRHGYANAYDAKKAPAKRPARKK